MARWRDGRWAAVGLAIFAASVARGADEPPALPREVREVQQSLGGPVVNQFPSLQPDATPTAPPPAKTAPQTDSAPQFERNSQPGVWPNWSRRSVDVVQAAAEAPQWSPPDGRRRAQIGSLRETAAQLDGSANRLEGLELYRQADALRALAQRLRMEARTMSGGAAAATWPNPMAAPQPDAPNADPPRLRDPERDGDPRRRGRQPQRQRDPDPTPAAVAPTEAGQEGE